MSEKTTAIIGAILAVFSWGISFVATKVALAYVSPTTVVWTRFAMGVVIIGFVVIIQGQFMLPSRKDLAYFALVGFIGITFHQWLQSTGLQTAQASTTSWIVATTPIFMVIVGWLFLRERLSLLQTLGIFIAACGVILVVSKGALGSILNGQFGTIGDLLILISSINWAFFSMFSKRGLKAHPPNRMVFYVMLFGWLMTSIFFISNEYYLELQNVAFDGWISLLFLGIVCSGLAYIFWYNALKNLPMSQTGAFVYLEPFITLIVAAIVLQELITIGALLGGAAILLGVWLVNQTH
jgi:drug/metabolite transporter (DMT)-like permease